MNTEEFYKIPKSLMMADGYISRRTGEPIALTSTAKLVYAYMLSRNKFFTEDLKSQHFETQSTIADACGVEYRAAGKILRSFCEECVLEADKLRPGGEGQWRWFYRKVRTDVMLWKGSISKFELIEEEPVKIPVKKEVKPVQKSYSPSWEQDEEPLPF